MKLILHLGTEKSGTTALQTWLQKNVSELRKQGVWVCQTLEISNHFGIVVLGAGLDAWPDLLNPIKITDETTFKKYEKAKITELCAEIELARNLGCHSFMITSEHLHSRIRKPEQAKRIFDILKGKFSDIECVLFLRPQADLSRSVQSNHVRWGVSISSETFINTANGHNYDYWSIFNIWKSAFKKSLLIVPYCKNPNVVEWFSKHLSIDESAMITPSARIKQSVTEKSAAILNALVPILPRGPQFVRLREEIISQTEGGEKITFSKCDADQITEKFSLGNQKLCEAVNYLDISDLEPREGDYPEHGNVDALGNMDCSDVLKRIFLT